MDRRAGDSREATRPVGPDGSKAPPRACLRADRSASSWTSCERCFSRAPSTCVPDRSERRSPVLRRGRRYRGLDLGRRTRGKGSGRATGDRSRCRQRSRPTGPRTSSSRERRSRCSAAGDLDLSGDRISSTLHGGDGEVLARDAAGGWNRVAAVEGRVLGWTPELALVSRGRAYVIPRDDVVGHVVPTPSRGSGTDVRLPAPVADRGGRGVERRGRRGALTRHPRRPKRVRAAGLGERGRVRPRPRSPPRSVSGTARTPRSPPLP